MNLLKPFTFLLLILSSLLCNAGMLEKSDGPYEWVKGLLLNNEFDYYLGSYVSFAEIDLDGDGDLDILLTSKNHENARAGSFWDIYYREKGSFQRDVNNEGENVTFRSDTFYIGPVKEIEAPSAIITYHPSNAVQGVTLAIIFEKISSTQIDKSTRELVQVDLTLDDQAIEKSMSINNKYFGKRAEEYFETYNTYTKEEAIKEFLSSDTEIKNDSPRN